MKKIFFYLMILGGVILLPDFSQAAPTCASVGGAPVNIDDPACYTSTWVSSFENCNWSFKRNDYECGPYHHSSLSDCSDDPYCVSIKKCWFHGKVYQNSCGGVAEHCTNDGPVPANFTRDNSYWSNTCYYTVPDTWGPPAVDGKRLAATVKQLSTSGTGCSNVSNISYVDAIPDLKINGSDTIITVNKADLMNIDWTSTYATSCSVPTTSTTVGGWNNPIGINGSMGGISPAAAPKPSSSTAPPTVLNYRLACTNPGLNVVNDTVPVRVICTPDLDPAWGECNRQCGNDGVKQRVLRYANCYEKIEYQDCNRFPCPVNSEWEEVKP